VNMIWLVAHTTVRGTKHHAPLDPSVPVAKKRVAALSTQSAVAIS
jgi:hypothetical protein